MTFAEFKDYIFNEDWGRVYELEGKIRDMNLDYDNLIELLANAGIEIWDRSFE